MTSYTDMPEDARVWVYQCSRPLTEQEIIIFNQQASAFIKSWVAHDLLLKA